jgi:hypothetical protein
MFLEHDRYQCAGKRSLTYRDEFDQKSCSAPMCLDSEWLGLLGSEEEGTTIFETLLTTYQSTEELLKDI